MEELITPKMRERIGKEIPVLTFKVSEHIIARTTEAVEDFNPLWLNADLGRQSRYGDRIAPLFLVGAITKNPELVIDNNVMDGQCKNLVNGGTEIEFFVPARIGDTITRKDKLCRLSVKEGKRWGKMLVQEWEKTFWNQNGELVAKLKQTNILYR